MYIFGNTFLKFLIHFLTLITIWLHKIRPKYWIEYLKIQEKYIMRFPKRWKIREKFGFRWRKSRHERSPRRLQRFCSRRRPAAGPNEEPPSSPTAAHCREVLCTSESAPRTTLRSGAERAAPGATRSQAPPLWPHLCPAGPGAATPSPRGRSLLIANTDILLPHCIGQISSRGHAYSTACHLKWNFTAYS